MRNDLREYVELVAGKWRTLAVGVVFFIVGAGLDLSETTGISAVSVPTEVARPLWILGSLIVFVIAPFHAFRKIKIELDGFKREIRLTAKLASYSANIPDPGPDKVSFVARVIWEAWTTRDYYPDKLGLNFIYVYDRRWYQLWKRTRFPQTGIPPNGQDTTQYRDKIVAGNAQTGEATFEYTGPRMDDRDPHWELELVLIMGMPSSEHRVPVFIDWDEMRSRGTNPPL